VITKIVNPKIQGENRASHQIEIITIAYNNAVAEALDPLRGFGFTLTTAKPRATAELEEKDCIRCPSFREPPYLYCPHVYPNRSLSVQEEIASTLIAHLQEASEELAEAFCSSSSSRLDNPTVFTSEGRHSLFF